MTQSYQIGVNVVGLPIFVVHQTEDNIQESDIQGNLALEKWRQKYLGKRRYTKAPTEMSKYCITVFIK